MIIYNENLKEMMSIAPEHLVKLHP